MTNFLRPDIQELLSQIIANQDYLRPMDSGSGMDIYTGNSAQNQNQSADIGMMGNLLSRDMRSVNTTKVPNRAISPNGNPIIAKPLLANGSGIGSQNNGTIAPNSRKRIGRNIRNSGQVTIMPVSGGNNMFLPLL